MLQPPRSAHITFSTLALAAHSRIKTRQPWDSGPTNQERARRQLRQLAPRSSQLCALSRTSIKSADMGSRAAVWTRTCGVDEGRHAWQLLPHSVHLHLNTQLALNTRLTRARQALNTLRAVHSNTRSCIRLHAAHTRSFARTAPCHRRHTYRVSRGLVVIRRHKQRPHAPDLRHQSPHRPDIPSHRRRIRLRVGTSHLIATPDMHGRRC